MNNDTGAFTLALVDAASRPWTGEAQIQIRNDQERVIYDQRKRYIGPARFNGLMAVPRGFHNVHVKPLNHVPASRFVTIKSTSVAECVIPLFVDRDVAEQHERAIRYPKAFQFESVKLAALGTVLATPNTDLSIEDGGVAYLRDGKSTYDGLVDGADRSHRRAVAALLNLYSKLTRTTVNGSSAWSLVKNIVALKEDRVYCEVDGAAAGQAVTAIETDGSGFKRFDSDTHDVPGPTGFDKIARTYKTDESFGNLQLTFWKRTDGNVERWCLDADVDERTGIGHVLDVLYHAITGARTSPFYVHQLLSRQGHPPPYDIALES
jgi:hypothetical protein